MHLVAVSTPCTRTSCVKPVLHNACTAPCHRRAHSLSRGTPPTIANLSNTKHLPLSRSFARMVSANGHSTAAPLVFRQLYDADSSTYTYILADGTTKEAVIIDPVDLQVERDLSLVDELGLKLLLAINTHCHADHITGSGKIKKLRPDVKSAISAASGARADVLLAPNDSITFGSHELKCLATPGHTAGCMSFYSSADGGRVFTGDALLIRGCGRTDFQGGSAATLYQSVHSQLLSLPGATLVYPAHDYKGRTCSSIAEEAAHNPRLTKNEADFVQLMDNLGLAYPKKIDVAVPANLKCGLDDSSIS